MSTRFVTFVFFFSHFYQGGGRNVFIESLILMSILGSPFSFLFPFIVLLLIDSIFCYFLNRREKLEDVDCQIKHYAWEQLPSFVLFCFVQCFGKLCSTKTFKTSIQNAKGWMQLGCVDSIRMDSLPKREFFSLSCPFQGEHKSQLKIGFQCSKTCSLL